jgi:WD40 repeat protein
MRARARCARLLSDNRDEPRRLGHPHRQAAIRARGSRYRWVRHISPDSRLLGVGTQDGKLLLIDPRTGKQTQPLLQAAASNIADVSFSPDGRSVAVGAADNTVDVWDLQSRTRLGNPFGPYPRVHGHVIVPAATGCLGSVGHLCHEYVIVDAGYGCAAGHTCR